MKKIGLWLPSRVSTQQKSSIEQPAILLNSIKNEIVRRLKKDEAIKLIQDVDFRKAVIVDNKVFLNDFCLNDLDLFFWFGKIDISSDSYPIQVLEVLEKETYVMNPSLGLKIGMDKFKTNMILRENSVPVPRNCLISRENKEYAAKVIEEMGEVLLKPRRGGRGLGITKISDKFTLLNFLDYCNFKEYFIEQFIPNNVEEFCGINVINGKVIHGYRKVGTNIEDNWKIHAKDFIDGKFIYVNPNKKQRKIALKIYKLLKLDLFGVDIIKGKDSKYYVVDVNTFPGLYLDMFEKAGIDGVGEIINSIKSHLKKGNSFR